MTFTLWDSRGVASFAILIIDLQFSSFHNPQLQSYHINKLLTEPAMSDLIAFIKRVNGKHWQLNATESSGVYYQMYTTKFPQFLFNEKVGNAGPENNASHKLFSCCKA